MLLLIENKKNVIMATKIKNIVFVVNPKCGKFSQKTIQKLLRICVKLQLSVEVRYTQYASHAIKLVAELDYVDLVISVGGDGTLNEVLNGNMLRKERLLISHIPMGTTNDIAEKLGLRKDPIQNLTAILEGEDRSIKIGKINDFYFFYHVATGVFSSVSYTTPIWLKKHLGYMAYVIFAIKEMTKKPQCFNLIINGHNSIESLVIVCTSSKIGGFRLINETTDELTIIISRISSWLKVVGAILSKRKRQSILEVSNVQSLTITTPHKWCVDGESLKKEYGNPPYHIEMTYANILLPKTGKNNTK